MFAGPESMISGGRAGEAHAKPAVLLEIARQPQFAFGAGKNPRADDVIGDQIPITAQTRFGYRIMDLLIVKKRHGNEGGLGFTPRIFLDRSEDIALEPGREQPYASSAP